MPHYHPSDAIDAYEAENSFYLRSHPSRMAKLLAHYELYKQIVPLPGAVVELGVYKGASFMRFASFRDILENAYSRPLIGFDAFGSFPREGIEEREDQRFIDRFEATGGQGISRADLEALLAAKGYANTTLVEGNVFSTLPDFVTAQPALKIALLHLDMDVYEPTAFALEQLLPHMARGGLVVFDDYGLVQGATRAADEACARLGVGMEKSPGYVIPAFFRAP
ncbi:TylF/MycF/NovP-related O-methyltransferase [Sphingomonas elodea]|uniref:TylF/MycF/NovP-related O-methyltransferase n=1 Tax=Sphingomonas elodea TaxID=179878 RepID=UPI0002630FEC|nr:TylF/MycF/NovP-related O-methyltransferase [Sphingomonas elodea]